MANPRSLTRLGRFAQHRLEDFLGVRIFRHPPPGRFFYPQLKALRDWQMGDIVFDVGANDGRTVLQLQALLPKPRIYAFEPVATTYTELLERTEQMENVKTYKLALDARAGSADIHLNKHSVLNSFTPHERDGIGSETVGISTIDQIMLDEALDFIEFLKIDTEGYELEVLRGASDALAQARIAILQVEIGFDNAPRGFVTFQEVTAFLKPLGYHLYGIFNQNQLSTQPPEHWPEGRQQASHPRLLAYCDAVFMAARP